LDVRFSSAGTDRFLLDAEPAFPFESLASIAAPHESAFGTKRTCLPRLVEVRFWGGRADMV